MSDPTSIKQLIQKLMPRGNEIVMGKVLSADPLKVQIVNDEKLILSRNMLIIPKRIYDEPLQRDEYVHVLSFANGKKYYILDRAVI